MTLAIFLLVMHYTGMPDAILFQSHAYRDEKACLYQANVMRGAVEHGASFKCERVEVK